MTSIGTSGSERRWPRCTPPSKPRVLLRIGSTSQMIRLVCTWQLVNTRQCAMAWLCRRQAPTGFRRRPPSRVQRPDEAENIGEFLCRDSEGDSDGFQNLAQDRLSHGDIRLCRQLCWRTENSVSHSNTGKPNWGRTRTDCNIGLRQLPRGLANTQKCL